MQFQKIKLILIFNINEFKNVYYKHTKIKYTLKQYP